MIESAFEDAIAFRGCTFPIDLKPENVCFVVCTPFLSIILCSVILMRLLTVTFGSREIAGRMLESLFNLLCFKGFHQGRMKLQTYKLLEFVEKWQKSKTFNNLRSKGVRCVNIIRSKVRTILLGTLYLLCF